MSAWRWICSANAVYADSRTRAGSRPDVVSRRRAKLYPLAFHARLRLPMIHRAVLGIYVPRIVIDATIRLSRAMLSDYDALPRAGMLDEQKTMDALIPNNPGMLGHVFIVVPGGLFFKRKSAPQYPERNGRRYTGSARSSRSLFPPMDRRTGEQATN